MMLYLIAGVIIFAGILTASCTLNKGWGIVLPNNHPYHRSIVDHLLVGLSSSAVFFGFILFLAAIYNILPSFYDVLGFIGLTLVPGILIFIGSVWQDFIIGKYRDWLVNKFGRKK